MTVRIPIPHEDVVVTATCPRCGHPLRAAPGWPSWACDVAACPTRLVPMYEDARFIDDDGAEWVPTGDEGWVDVAP